MEIQDLKLSEKIFLIFYFLAALFMSFCLFDETKISRQKQICLDIFRKWKRQKDKKSAESEKFVIFFCPFKI